MARDPRANDAPPAGATALRSESLTLPGLCDPRLGRALEVAPGIHQLSVPTPLTAGAVNAYLLEGRPLTLIDGGPNLATSWHALQQLIATTGHEDSEIELVLITHQHLDHEGLADLLAKRSGAEVGCLGHVADYIDSYNEEQRRDDRFGQALMLRHGVEPHVVDAFGSIAAVRRGLGAPVTATRRLEHRDLVDAGGRTLRALHRPGHSTGDTVFHDEVAGVIFSGDHLLRRISSNALVTGVVEEAGRPVRTRPLIDYQRSLMATSQLEGELILGGHGEAIHDHRALIAQRLTEQRQRADGILELVTQRARSAHELARALFGRTAFSQAFLTVSEVLGHLDLLIEDGRVAEDDTGDVTIFCAT